MTPENEHRREPRHLFFATVELLEAQHETRVNARTGDLSFHGCYVATPSPFPSGSKVRVTITHAGATFTSNGTVAHSRPNQGMGISFTEMESDQKRVVMKWLAGMHGD